MEKRAIVNEKTGKSVIGEEKITQETALEKIRREKIAKEKLESEDKKLGKDIKKEPDNSNNVSSPPTLHKNKDAASQWSEDKEISVKDSQRIDKFSLSYIEDYEEEEAKKLIEECLGFEPIRTCGFNMAVKVYVRPEDVHEFTRPDGKKVSLYLPDEARAHDKFVNNVGLVISQGPLCFIGDFFQEKWQMRLLRKLFGKFMKPTKLVPWCKVGDWVVFDRNAGPQINYRGLPVTLIHDKYVRAVVPKPTYVSRY